MDNENVVFDAERIIALKLNGPDGVKTVRVRFPSDEEWIERQRRRKVIVKDLGRGQSETDIPGREEVDAAFIAKLRVEDAEPVEIDQYEAMEIAERLSLAEVADVVPVGGSYRVSTRVLGGTTTHLLKTPTAKDAFEHRRGFARVIDLPYGRQQITVNLAPVGALYKRLCEATEGYVGPVPIIHQVVAVKAVMDAINAALQEDKGENF